MKNKLRIIYKYSYDPADNMLRLEKFHYESTCNKRYNVFTIKSITSIKEENIDTVVRNASTSQLVMYTYVQDDKYALKMFNQYVADSIREKAEQIIELDKQISYLKNIHFDGVEDNSYEYVNAIVYRFKKIDNDFHIIKDTEVLAKADDKYYRIKSNSECELDHVYRDHIYMIKDDKEKAIELYKAYKADCTRKKKEKEISKLENSSFVQHEVRRTNKYAKSFSTK